MAPDQHEVLLGKRYADEASGIELLCTKPGPGPLAVDGRPLVVKGAKPLPVVGLNAVNLSLVLEMAPQRSTPIGRRGQAGGEHLTYGELRTAQPVVAQRRCVDRG